MFSALYDYFKGESGFINKMMQEYELLIEKKYPQKEGETPFFVPTTFVIIINHCWIRG